MDIISTVQEEGHHLRLIENQYWKKLVLAGPVLDGVFTIYDGDSSLMATQNVPPIEIYNILESVSTILEVDMQETPRSC